MLQNGETRRATKNRRLFFLWNIMTADDRGVDSVSRKNRPVFLESLEASAMLAAKFTLGIGLWNLRFCHQMQKLDTNPPNDNVSHKSVIMAKARFDMSFLRIPQ